MGVPQLQLTAHLYERREVELSFQSAALAGAVDEAVYWLLELCESGWVDDAWNQLWLAYYDFYAAHNPQFEGELMELMRLRKTNGKQGRIPLLHGASALIGRRRSAGAWLIRQGALKRAEKAATANGTGTMQEEGGGEVEIVLGAGGVSAVEYGGAGAGAVAGKERDWAQAAERMHAGPEEAAEALVPLARGGADWAAATPLYTELVASTGCEVGGACGAWGSAGDNPLAVICALLVHLQAYWSGVEEAEDTLDLSPAEPDRALVEEALRLARLSRVTPAGDRLLLWRQYPIRDNLGCFGLPRDGLPPGGLREHLHTHWLRWTAGCRPWDRAVTRCGGARRVGTGEVDWPDEEAEDRFHSMHGPDLDELPQAAIDAGAPSLRMCWKIRWLHRLWPVKPKPDLWEALLQDRKTK